MKVDSSDERFQRARRVAASLRPDWSDDQRERALHRALIEKHGLLGVDDRLLLPWESVMLAAAHLELSVEDPWLVRPLWVALLEEEPEVCGQCAGPCESRFARCWGCDGASVYCEKCGSPSTDLSCPCGGTTFTSGPRERRG